MGREVVVSDRIRKAAAELAAAYGAMGLRVVGLFAFDDRDGGATIIFPGGLTVKQRGFLLSALTGVVADAMDQFMQEAEAEGAAAAASASAGAEVLPKPEGHA